MAGSIALLTLGVLVVTRSSSASRTGSLTPVGGIPDSSATVRMESSKCSSSSEELSPRFFAVVEAPSPFPGNKCKGLLEGIGLVPPSQSSK